MAIPVTTSATAVARAEAAAARARMQAKEPVYGGQGLRVRLMAEKGLTAPGLLAQPFRFQMPPTEDFSIGYSHAHTDYDTIGGEQLSRPGAVALRTVSFSTLFLDYDVSWQAYHRGAVGATAAPIPPDIVTEELEEVLTEGTPVRLQVGRVTDVWELNMMATLRTLEVSERAGEPDARYVNVGFVEFKKPDKIARKKLGKKRATGAAPPNQYNPTTPTSVPIRVGDTRTLHGLAIEFYGSAEKWRVIAAASGLTNVSPSEAIGTLHTGLAAKRLTIPKIPHAATPRASRGSGGVLYPVNG